MTYRVCVCVYIYIYTYIYIYIWKYPRDIITKLQVQILKMFLHLNFYVHWLL